MYLIIGGSGFLGRYLINNVFEMTEENVIATYATSSPPYTHARLTWKNIDVCSVEQVRELKKLCTEPVKTIYCSAYHHPDKVEDSPEFAWEVNIIALAQFVNIFHDIACFYYPSTDAVYGEGSKDYKFLENDSLNPVNLYGKHKVLAEQVTLAKGFNVVRFPFIIGTSLVESKKHFFDHIKSNLERGTEVKMFEDSYRSTLDFNQSASILIELIEKCGTCSEKIINISGDDILSKYEVAILMAEKYNLNKNLIKPISFKEAQSIFKAKRAKSAVLDNSKIKEILSKNSIKLKL